jgi:dolichyl-phosphate beta-glucosyltransferase
MDVRDPGRGRDRPITSLIFPVYNPGSTLERTWREVKHFLHHGPGSWEIIFVCDGCTDGSPTTIAQLARTEKDCVRLVSYSPNRGKGYAVRQGLDSARGAWRIFTDVDLAYGFNDILRMAQVLQAGSPVAVASRTHPDSQMVLPTRLQGYAYRRHLQSLAFSAVARLLLPLTQQDTQAGLKGLSADAVAQVLPHLACDGFGFDCELLTACVRYGLAIAEVPVCVRYDDKATTTSFAATGRMLRELWRIRQTWRQMPEPRSVAPPGHRKAA